MPGVIADVQGTKKRKRSVPKDANADVTVLEAQIQESSRHYNNIPKLLAIANEEAEAISESNFSATAALGRVYFRLLSEGRLRGKNGASSEEELITNWLKKNYADYQKCLFKLLRNVRSETTALKELMQLVNVEVTSAGTAADSAWRTGVFAKTIDNLLGFGDNDTASGSAVLAFAEDYAQKFDDVRHATFTLVADRLSHPESAPHAVAASLELLCALPVPTEAHDFCNNTLSKKPRAHQSSTTHKNRAQAAWLALFACALTKAQKKTLLNLTTHLIVPWFTKPELLMDFLTDSFNTGGATSLLALAGLFHLMQAKNLDYPSFYTKLYSLLDAAVLHSKHRSRFLRQLNVFLSSTHLPAALVASFLKRLARLALHAPPAAVVAVVPWSYNMLRAHPACTFMLHRDAVLADEDEVVADPFDMREQDPMETQALDSCLWELDALRRHYHPNVASVAGIVAQQFTKLSYNLEDFLDHSYGSLLEAELGKDLKKTPVVEFEIPKRVFTLPGEQREEEGPGVLEALMGSLLEVS